MPASDDMTCVTCKAGNRHTTRHDQRESPAREPARQNRYTDPLHTASAERRHTTLTWVERNFGYAVARAYAGPHRQRQRDRRHGDLRPRQPRRGRRRAGRADRRAPPARHDRRVVTGMAALTADAPSRQRTWACVVRSRPGPADRPPRTGPRRLPGRARAVRSWPLLVLAAPAAGRGVVRLGRHRQQDRLRAGLPAAGIWPSLHLDTTSPCRPGGGLRGVRAARLAGQRACGQRADPPVRQVVRDLLLRARMAGQAAYHLLAQAGTARAPWPITTIVSCLPVLVLGMDRASPHAARRRRLRPRDARGPARTGTPARPPCPHLPAETQRAEIQAGNVPLQFVGGSGLMQRRVDIARLGTQVISRLLPRGNELIGLTVRNLERVDQRQWISHSFQTPSGLIDSRAPYLQVTAPAGRRAGRLGKASVLWGKLRWPALPPAPPAQTRPQGGRQLPVSAVHT